MGGVLQRNYASNVILPSGLKPPLLLLSGSLPPSTDNRVTDGADASCIVSMATEALLSVSLCAHSRCFSCLLCVWRSSSSLPRLQTGAGTSPGPDSLCRWKITGSRNLKESERERKRGGESSCLLSVTHKHTLKNQRLGTGISFTLWSTAVHSVRQAVLYL